MTRHAPALLAALALTLGASLAVKATPQAPASAPAAVDFVRDVQPILEKQCSECHGPKKAKGKLRLHAPQYVARGGEAGALFVAGDPEHSLIVRRLLGLDGEDRMPLDEDPLSEAELGTIKGWIAAGGRLPAGPDQTTLAAEPEHWSYVKPVRPEILSLAAMAAQHD